MKSFDALARPTGGRALSGPAATAMSQVATDLGTYYWLGFSPGGADRRQHRIAVQTRRQGLTARARSSYSDIPPGSTAAARAESILLFGSAAAVPGPAPAASRQLKVSAGTPRPAGRGKLVVDLSVEVPFALLTFTPRTGGGMVAEVPLVVAARDEKGERANLAGHFQVTVPSSPQPGGTTHFSTRVELRRLRQHIVVGLSDAQTGDIVTGELEIRPPA